MMETLIRIGFGLVVIAMGFLVAVFYRAYCDRDKLHDRRYRVVALALSVGSVGVGMWAFNPLLQAFGGPPLPGIGMFVASALILLSASSLIGSTAMGGAKTTLKCFLLVSAAWVAACLLMDVFR
jgi:hypothetical protein